MKINNKREVIPLPVPTLDEVKEKGPERAHSTILELVDKINELEQRLEKEQEKSFWREKIEEAKIRDFKRLQEENSHSKEQIVSLQKQLEKRKEETKKVKRQLQKIENDGLKSTIKVKNKQIKTLEQDKKEYSKKLDKSLDLLSGKNPQINNSPTYNNNPTNNNFISRNTDLIKPTNNSKSLKKTSPQLEITAGQKIWKGFKILIDGIIQLLIEIIIKILIMRSQV